jgi:hypothetical protein
MKSATDVAAERMACILEVINNRETIRQLRAERDRLRDRLEWLRAYREGRLPSASEVVN